ncbi:HSF4 protein, partial [Polypterus senegalus]
MPRVPAHLRERALGMLQGGMRTADVARAINCHVRTVRRLRQRYRETGRTADHPRSGKPRVTTPAQDRYIRISHLRDSQFIDCLSRFDQKSLLTHKQIRQQSTWRRGVALDSKEQARKDPNGHSVMLNRSVILHLALTVEIFVQTGTSFHVFDQGRFAKEVLPKYFKHNNMASFVRQLNMYGFRKVVNIEQSGLVKPERDDTEFQHLYFLQGHEHLLEHIKRKVSIVKSEETKVRQEDLSKLLYEMQVLRSQQESMDCQMQDMKQLLIQFLFTHIQSNPHSSVGMKRKLPLMLDDGSTSPPISKFGHLLSMEDLHETYFIQSPSSESAMCSNNTEIASGPIISDVTDMSQSASLTLPTASEESRDKCLMLIKQEPASPSVQACGKAVPLGSCEVCAEPPVLPVSMVQSVLEGRALGTSGGLSEKRAKRPAVEHIDEDLSIKVNFLEINYDGTVSQSKPWRIVTSCNMDAYGFPFDRQTCFLTFGPYVNTVEEIIVKAASNSTTVQKLTDQHYIDRGEWDLQSIEVSNQNLTFGEEVFSKVRYKLNLRRIPVLYIINLVVPACFLIILDFASMFIPINGGERLGFKITVVLGFSVLLLIMNDLLPSTSSTPLLGVFFSLSIALMVISIFATISILYMVELSSMRKSVPIFLKKWVLTYLAKILLVKHQPVGSGDAAEINNTFTNIQLANNLSETMKEQPNVDSNAQVQLWRKLLSEVTMIRQQLATIRQDEETRSEWQMVSYVVDRFTCILYFLTIVINTELGALQTCSQAARVHRLGVWSPAVSQAQWIMDTGISEAHNGSINEDVSVKINFLNVAYDGTISQSKPWRIVSTCMLNARKFPFDTQKCSITFGPYVHNIEEVVMRSIFSANELKEITLAHYINRGEWELLDIEVLDENLTFGKNLFSKVKYTITLQRTSALYIINLIAPAIFLLMVDFGSMFIPITAGERLGVKVTIVLGFSVLLLILNDLVPSTNSTPILDVSRAQNEVKEEWKTEQESHEVRLLKMLHLQIPAIRNHLEKASEEESNKAQWLMAALVIDRLLCILYVLTVVVSMTAVAAVWASN